MKLAGALAIVYVVWGSTYLGMAVADRTLPPLLMLSVRFLIAGALLYAWSRRGAASSRSDPAGAQWRAAAIVGSALLVARHGRRRLGGAARPVGTAALIVASVPLFMAVIDRACFGIRLPLGAAPGIATGLVGVAILAGPVGRRRPARRRGAPLRLVRLGGRLRLCARRAAAARPVRERRDADADGRRVLGVARARDRARGHACIRRRSRRRRSARCSS